MCGLSLTSDLLPVRGRLRLEGIVITPYSVQRLPFELFDTTGMCRAITPFQQKQRESGRGLCGLEMYHGNRLHHSRAQCCIPSFMIGFSRVLAIHPPRRLILRAPIDRAFGAEC
jgi:hypothetical protein